jgi:lysophospholipid acyltransferase (LPLAT)-like uncharacterized protein
MTSILLPAAYLWGRVMASYTLLAARPERMTIEGKENILSGPAIYIGWHEANLVEMTLIRSLPPRPRRSFVPNGVVGAAMRGLLAGVKGVDPVTLPEDGAGVRAAMRAMASALREGADVIVACDGPAGPARKVKTGAIWLAQATGCPIVPVGCAVRPALRVPRWDRLMVPLPGARSVATIDQPIRIDRSQRVDAHFLAAIEGRLNAATERAWEIATRPITVSPGPTVDLMEDR